MQFQQSGAVYTQIGIELSNQSYSNGSATTVNRHTPLLWTKTMYCIGADLNLKCLDHCPFSLLAKHKQLFTFTENSRFKRTMNKVAVVFS